MLYGTNEASVGGCWGGENAGGKECDRTVYTPCSLTVELPLAPSQGMRDTSIALNAREWESGGKDVWESTGILFGISRFPFWERRAAVFVHPL